MMEIRPAGERGHVDYKWLETFHTFSFNTYHDDNYMGFRSLRVINEDRVAPGKGFGTHPHNNMEILTYVMEGALMHRDNMGNGSIIHPGEIQRLSAGKGILHSEFNASDNEMVHFLQIWILPDRKNIEPGYDQKIFTVEERKGIMRLIASADGRNNSLLIHQDVSIYSSLLDHGQPLYTKIRKDRHIWLQLARGSMELNGNTINAGDGVALSDEDEVRIISRASSEFLLFDLA
jgi:redox-sensitive bicupin YhaK (pirin superfamily)